ncbi:helix-turn-helix domain-containing protein [Carboxylicivirga sp. RSCT41]|uniref:helix-turn-helix domain-containing protein n=1 Tax=Carboxylicivirga agarovorans TaxID=3417570 RepID=UPI003D34C747
MENQTYFYIQQEYLDFEFLKEAAKNWELDFKKLDTSEFYGKLSLVDIGLIQISRTTLKGTIDQDGLTPKGYRTFVIPTRDTSPYFWLNRKVDSSKLLVFSKTCTLDGISHDYFDVYTISIWEEHLQKMIDEHKFINLSKTLINDESAFSINNHFIYYMQSFLEIIFTRLEKEPSAVNNPNLIHKLKYRLPFMILSFIDRKKGYSIKQLNRKRDVAICIAVSYISKNIRSSITMKQLCKVTGVSERTLEYGFLERFMVSPITYINHCKLNCIRMELIANTSGELISVIARHYGVNHLGHFASDYYQLFNELPSETKTIYSRKKKILAL